MGALNENCVVNLKNKSHKVTAQLVVPDGGASGVIIDQGGTATLYVDGQQAGSGRVERTHFTMFTFDETTDGGADTGAPVTDDYPARGNGFTGTVKWVQLDLGDDDHSHLIPSEHHLQVAMTRQ